MPISLSKLQGLAVVSHKSLLYKFEELRQKETDTLPMLVVYLSSGHQLLGQFVRIGAAHHQQEILVLLQETQKQGSNLVFIDIAQITSLSIENIEALSPEMLKNLLDISIKKQLAPINRLEFQRFIKQKTDSLFALTQINTELGADVLLQDQNQLAHLKEMIDKTIELIAQIWQDALGKEALATKVKKIKFDIANESSTLLKNNELQFIFQKNKLHIDDFAAQELQIRIEALL